MAAKARGLRGAPREGASMERAEVKRIVETVVDRLVLPAAPGSRATEPGPAATGPAPPPAEPAPPASPPVPAGGRARWVDWRGAAGEAAATPAPGMAPPAPAPHAAPLGADTSRVVAVGADHGAFRLKQSLLRYLREELGWQVLDLGTDSEEPVDYPDVARAVATAVAEGRAARGVVLDAMGIGSAMTANRVPGVLCAVCHDAQTARNAREHNDANVLSLGSHVVSPGLARQVVRLFLTTPHAGGRHARRVSKIRALDESRATPSRGS
jgi:ribose 5-phosphate isomerase B